MTFILKCIVRASRYFDVVNQDGSQFCFMSNAADEDQVRIPSRHLILYFDLKTSFLYKNTLEWDAKEVGLILYSRFIKWWYFKGCGIMPRRLWCSMHGRWRNDTCWGWFVGKNGWERMCQKRPSNDIYSAQRLSSAWLDTKVHPLINSVK